MAFAETGAANAVKPLTITTAIEDFDQVIARAAGYVERLQKLADRIHGPRPTPVGTDAAKESEPVSTIQALRARRGRLVRVIDDLERTLGSLEEGI